jgi:hypothetical protein
MRAHDEVHGESGCVLCESWNHHPKNPAVSGLLPDPTDIETSLFLGFVWGKIALERSLKLCERHQKISKTLEAHLKTRMTAPAPHASLRADPTRVSLPETGIPVRALDADGEWSAVDIAHLDRASFDAWIRSRGSIEWPIRILMLLFKHPEPS